MGETKFPYKEYSKLSKNESAYEVNTNCCLFEGLFKVKKNDLLLFGIPFSVLEILTFRYNANEKTDDVIGGSTKTVQHSIKNNAVFFKLGTRIVHHKRIKMTPVVPLQRQPLCRWSCFN